MMQKSRGPVQIESRTLSGAAGAQGGALRVEIEYPAFTGSPAAGRLNGFYRRRAEARYRACGGLPRLEAERQKALWAAKEPFEPLRAGQSFSVMYNQGGFLSIFCDSWEELGSAGSFLRRQAHTWELAAGRPVPAGRFFRRGSPWRRFAADQIARQIDEWEAGQPGAFFADARKKSRALHGYYLADDGMVFYYPAEWLGPRVLGIPSFLIRYTDFGDMLALPL